MLGPDAYQQPTYQHRRASLKCGFTYGTGNYRAVRRHEVDAYGDGARGTGRFGAPGSIQRGVNEQVHGRVEMKSNNTAVKNSWGWLRQYNVTAVFYLAKGHYC